MSIFGALNTAVSGLSAQSQAFTDISNNISNSQTVGYKATDTTFSDYVLNSTSSQVSGTVVASTAQQTQAQGTITSSTNALALAISGNGFFNVAESNGDTSTTSTSFQDTDYYTRNGDFTENAQGYLVNSSNEYLKGYMVGSDGTLDTSTLQAINVSDIAFRPTETSTVTYSASLPGSTAATDGTDTSASTTQSETVYDSSGAAHTVDYDWSYSSSDSSWTVSATVDGASTPSAAAKVTFDSSGDIASIAQQTNVGSTPATYGTATTTSGSTASFTVPTDFDGTSGSVAVDLGTIGSSTGTTMSTTASSAGSAATISSDSVTSGTYTGISMESDGSIMATFSNSSGTDVSQLVGKVPLATFADADALTPVDGEAYTANAATGSVSQNLAGENGAGSLETSSVEDSTTDLDTDLTKLITAQQAYGANAKVVTTANDMLQTVLSMKQ